MLQTTLGTLATASMMLIYSACASFCDPAPTASANPCDATGPAAPDIRTCTNCAKGQCQDCCNRSFNEPQRDICRTNCPGGSASIAPTQDLIASIPVQVLVAADSSGRGPELYRWLGTLTPELTEQASQRLKGLSEKDRTALIAAAQTHLPNLNNMLGQMGARGWNVSTEGHRYGVYTRVASAVLGLGGQSARAASSGSSLALEACTPSIAVGESQQMEASTSGVASW